LARCRDRDRGLVGPAYGNIPRRRVRCRSGIPCAAGTAQLAGRRT
jgi:hypothetical protein